jgi:zinc-ribbon domain
VPIAKEQSLPAAAGPDERPMPAPARRRVPALVLGLGGAAIAIAYGLVGMKMRYGPPLVMIGLGGLTLVLAGIALWRVIDPLSRADLPMPTAPRAPQRLRELEREKQLVLKAIKEIEFDYQMRKIAEPHYKEMIERYRGRAMRLIGELEAGDNFRPLIERELKDRLAALEAAPEAPPATATATAHAAATTEVGRCPACGTRNDEDAQFCKKCGGKVGTF